MKKVMPRKRLKSALDLISDLRLIAEQCGAPKDSDATTVGKFIWEKGATPDIALAARTCGRLQEQFAYGNWTRARVESDASDTFHDWVWCVNPMRPE